MTNERNADMFPALLKQRTLAVEVEAEQRLAELRRVGVLRDRARRNLVASVLNGACPDFWERHTFNPADLFAMQRECLRRSGNMVMFWHGFRAFVEAWASQRVDDAISIVRIDEIESTFAAIADKSEAEISAVRGSSLRGEA